MKLQRFETIIEKVKEAFFSVIPIALLVLLMSFTICPLPNDIFLAFIVGTCMLIIGLGLFSLGAEMSMTRMGTHIGSTLTKSRNIPIIAIISLIVGVLITISEPDLHVLASYTGEQKLLFVLAVALGLGIFLVIAVMRIVFNVKIKHLLSIGYGLVILLAIIIYAVDPKFLAIAFDAGGVTTGAMSVPFVMSIGAGIAAISSQNGEDDSSFGLMAICSIGPILAILLFGLFGGLDDLSYTAHKLPQFDDSQGMFLSFIEKTPSIIKDVLMGLVPIIIFFFVYQFFTTRITKEERTHIGIGAGYTFIGMVLFLVGVNVGFMPVGSYLGSTLAMGNMEFIVVPVGMVIGFCMTYAEPAVGVLEKQVENATAGTIPKKILPLMMAIGVSLAAGLSMLRALTGISIMPMLIVGYIAAVTLTFYCPPIFTSIAFDAGGVASGVMAATFLLPLSIGISTAMGGASDTIMLDAFGTIALVAMTPTISIQILGIVFKAKQTAAKARSVAIVNDTEVIELVGLNEIIEDDIEIIEFDLNGVLS